MADKVPLGKPLELTDKQLTELSKVTPKDIQQARKLWIESVPDKLKGLIDIQEITKA